MKIQMTVNGIIFNYSKNKINFKKIEQQIR